MKNGACDAREPCYGRPSLRETGSERCAERGLDWRRQEWLAGFATGGVVASAQGEDLQVCPRGCCAHVELDPVSSLPNE